MSLETKSNDSAGTGAPVGMSLQAYIEQLKRENQSLSARLLGVNELARLLQEKTEACANHVEKNKRQEIAIIRLENRCSNLDKKLRQMSSSGGGTGGTPAQVRTSQSPFIPGPSRQILETLMKENSELKKTINKLHKKGETGYIEAVKLSQLEEVIDQKNQELEFLQQQISTLTSPHNDENPQSWMLDPGMLKREIIRMQHSMKVKDRFCALLSDQLQLLQQGNQTKQHEDVSEAQDQTDSVDNVSKNTDSITQELEQLRKDKNDLMDSAKDTSVKMKSLESEISSLKSRIEDLNAYNDTLLEEKGRMLEQSNSSTTSKDLEAKLLEQEKSIQVMETRHSAELHSRDQRINVLEGEIDNAQLRIGVLQSRMGTGEYDNSKLTQLERTNKQLSVQLRSTQEDLAAAQSNLRDLAIKNSELKVLIQQSTYGSIKGVSLHTGGFSGPQSMHSEMRGGIAVTDNVRKNLTGPQSAVDNPIRPVVAVLDRSGSTPSPTTTAPTVYPPTTSISTQPGGYRPHPPTNAGYYTGPTQGQPTGHTSNARFQYSPSSSRNQYTGSLGGRTSSGMRPPTHSLGSYAPYSNVPYASSSHVPSSLYSGPYRPGVQYSGSQGTHNPVGTPGTPQYPQRFNRQTSDYESWPEGSSSDSFPGGYQFGPSTYMGSLGSGQSYSHIPSSSASSSSSSTSPLPHTHPSSNLPHRYDNSSGPGGSNPGSGGQGPHFRGGYQ